MIPNISYDFLPHRSHVVLALLASCLTWQWFIKPLHAKKLISYLILGLIMGMGFLSKFNYLLFLFVLFSAAFTIKAYRNKILQFEMLFSFFIAIVLASPYWLWLCYNPHLGFYAAYKFSIVNESKHYGLIRLVTTCFCYLVPVFLVLLFFLLRV